MSITMKPPRQGDWPLTVTGLIPYALMFWLFLGIVVVPLLLVATLSSATLYGRLGRFDGSYRAAFFSAVILASAVLLCKVLLLERPVGLSAIADRYYGVEWVALLLGIFLSRVFFKSLRPGAFYKK